MNRSDLDCRKNAMRTRAMKRMSGIAMPVACLAMLSLLIADEAVAQTFPSKPLKIIVHSSPGGQLDITTRLVAQGMSERLGQPVVVENKPGAEGLLGIREAKRAAADGYTLLAAASTITALPATKNEPGYDLSRDFAGIGPMVKFPYLLLTATDKPYRSAADLIARARTSPGSLYYATGGKGSTSNLAMSTLMQQAGIRMQQVPYKGNAAAMPDLVAGRADVMFDSYGSAGPNVKAGRLRVLGVTSSRRLDVLPDAPTLEEEGVARYAYDLWLGLLAPSGTPKEVIDKLSGTLRSVLQSKRVMERAHEDGGQVMILSPEQFDKQLKRELAEMETLTRSLGFVKE